MVQVNRREIMGRTLVLGGARSGKSRYAQICAETAANTTGQTPVMIVTAQAFDDEMQERIQRHQNDRGDLWHTVEAPLALADNLRAQPQGSIVVVDCLTLWLTNQMLAENDLGTAVSDLVDAITNCQATHLWLVSNEVGMSLVPENALGRRFRDEAGRLHQQLAAVCDETYLIAAGMKLKMEPF